MYKPKILAFAGSLRKGSFNKLLLKAAIKGAEEAGATVTFVDLYDYPLPVYSEDLEAKEGLPENVLKLKEMMWKSDGFLISSPEYNSGISGVLKNMIDWTSRKAKPDEVYLSCFIDKVAVLMSASPGDLGGLRGLVQLRSILENIYTIVLPSQKTLPQAHQAFDSEGHFKNTELGKTFEELGKKLAQTIIKLKEETLVRH